MVPDMDEIRINYTQHWSKINIYHLLHLPNYIILWPETTVNELCRRTSLGRPGTMGRRTIEKSASSSESPVVLTIICESERIIFVGLIKNIAQLS